MKPPNIKTPALRQYAPPDRIWGVPIPRYGAMARNIAPLPDVQEQSRGSSNGSPNKRPGSAPKLTPLDRSAVIDDHQQSTPPPTDSEDAAQCSSAQQVTFADDCAVHESNFDALDSSAARPRVDVSHNKFVSKSGAKAESSPTAAAQSLAYQVFMESPAELRAKAANQKKKVHGNYSHLPPALPVLNPFKVIAHPVELGEARKIKQLFAEINATAGQTVPGRGHTQGAKKATNIRGLALRSKGQADDTSIAIADIPTFMDKMGEPLSKEDIKAALDDLKVIDADGDGQIECDQMIRFWPQLQQRFALTLAQEMPLKIVEAMNKVRADPPAYARKLRQMRPYFTGKSYRLPGDTVPTLTSEGWTAVQAAIDRLNQTPPMPPLQISNGLMRAAELHAVDLGSRGLASHVGSDGNGPLERVALCGQWLFDGRGEEASDDKLAENLSFGGRSADEHVYITIVDDGVRSRQHRNNVIDPQLQWVGVAVARHTSSGTVCVSNFAHDFVDKEERDLPPRPLRPKASGPAASYPETQAAKKLQTAYKRRLAVKLRKAIIQDEELIAAGLVTCLQAGYPHPVSHEFRQALYKLPWKLQQCGKKALQHKRCTVRITLARDFVQIKCWGGGLDAVLTENTNAPSNGRR